MFLHILNDRQLSAFLSLAKQFIAADEQLSSEESNHLELMMAETGWNFDEEVPDRPFEEAAAEIDSGRARKVTLLELIGVGHADDEFHPAENAFINTLAERWGVPAEEVAQMESWVQRQLALAREAEELIA
jgi:hypothetical protein